MKCLILMIRVFFFVGFLLTCGCEKDSINTKQSEVSDPDVEDEDLVPDGNSISHLVVLPEELKLTDNETGKMFLSVEPVAEIQWKISNKPDWINIEPSSGTINTQKIELNVIPDIEDLAVGDYSGNIEISSNGAETAEISVNLSVESHPVAQIMPNPVEFSAIENQKTVVIYNIGKGLLNWELKSQVEWLTFNVDDGAIVENGKREIIATVNRKGLPVGNRIGKAALISNSENGNETVEFAIEIPVDVTLSVLPETLDFKYFENSKSFIIKNEGNTVTDWKIKNTSDYITLQPSTGSLEKGDSIEVTISLDMVGNPTNVYNNTLLIENDAKQTVPIYLTKNYYNDEKWFIDGAVVDAEYDRVNDVMIFVTSSPDALIKFKTSDKTFETVLLDHSPQNVSISPDGNHAVSGHDGYFSYVDLNLMEVNQVFPVSIDIFDIVIASNGWVYATPTTGQWTDFSNIELSTGIETKSAAMLFRSGTKIKLHPSGNFVYGCKTDTSPTDFEKYDITAGTLKYLYDSKYHGTYDFGKNIWISDNGNFLMGKGRTVFSSSTEKATDIIYISEMEGAGRVITLDYSSNVNRIYAVFSTDTSWDEIPENEVRKYDAETFAFISTAVLPDFLIPDGTGGGELYESQGHYGFFNSEGSMFYVILKTPDDTVLDEKWAVTEIDVD